MSTKLKTTSSSNPKETDPVTSDKSPYLFKEGDWITERYQVIVPLGLGGFAQVYHCKDERLDRPVSVKVLTKKDVGLEEAQAAARLKHPHIVSVYDVATPQDELPFIIFDHVAGETLEERLKEAQHQRLPLDEESLRIVRQISTALDYAHKQGVIHQDVKPSNIILDRNGNAHLTDFGLAKIKQPDGKSAHTEYQRQLSGTISHMAPELLRGSGRSGDERSDLYSLGVVVYEMLNGPPPYPGLPQGIEAVLRQALDQNPAKRYPSCQDFADALEQAVQAYQAASNKYDEAQKLIELGRWRRAKPILEALEQQTPGFKDTAHHLEQARLQGRLSKFYKQAQDAVSRKDYQSALHALQALSQLSPDYDVTDLPQQVEDGLAREKQRQLNNQYQRTEELFQEKRYQDCLDILVAIREQDPDYVYPSENLARIAREQVELQQQQRDRYDQGAEYMRQEQWEQALAIFQDLQSQAPDYEDVDTRLAMARHMARLSSLLQQAQELLDDGQPAACVEKLNKLQGIDPEYKQEQVAQLKLEAMSKQQNILSQTCPRCGHENQGPHHRKTCSQCDAELLLGINEVLKGRYHVLQELGRGAVGAVFQAQDKETGQVVAIKEQRDKTQFEYEQSILQSLDHPQLPHIYDHFEHEDKLYLVIEFVDGRSLGDIIDENAKAGRFQRWHLVDGWAMELYTVLEYLHNKRIIHGDIKPANIRLNTQGEIVLVDLGVAKNLSSMPSEETPEYEKSAQEGKSVPEDRVTVGYAAIEQFLPGYEPPDERADIYALGATLYAVLTNTLPPTSLNLYQQKEQLLPLQDINPDVPDRLAQAIERAMALQPQDRFPSIQEMCLALQGKSQPRETDNGATLETAWCLRFNDQLLETVTNLEMVIGRIFEQVDFPGLNLAQYPELPEKDLKTVSKEHCQISRIEEKFYIKDLESRNGTRLNGKQLEQQGPYLIQDGDQIRLGRITLKFETAKVKPDSPTSPSPSESTRAAWRLRFQDQGLEAVTGSEITIGRSSSQTQPPDLNLAQYTDLPKELGTVSGEHCHISRIEERFYIKDLESRNGTWLNEERLEPQKPHPIQNGDQVRLGKITLEFEIVA